MCIVGAFPEITVASPLWGDGINNLRVLVGNGVLGTGDGAHLAEVDEIVNNPVDIGLGYPELAGYGMP